MLNNNLHNEKGFTLVEVIISIAVFSFISAIVLRLFVMSSDLSEKVRIEDVANVYAANALEICKESTAPNDVMNNDFFDQGLWTGEEDLSCVLYYDEHWQKVVEASGTYALVLQIQKYESQYSTLMAQDLKVSDAHGILKTGLYQLTVTIRDLSSMDLSDRVVATLQTNKYFVFEE